MNTMTLVDSMMPKAQLRAWIVNNNVKIIELMQKIAMKLVYRLKEVKTRMMKENKILISTLFRAFSTS